MQVWRSQMHDGLQDGLCSTCKLSFDKRPVLPHLSKKFSTGTFSAPQVFGRLVGIRNICTQKLQIQNLVDMKISDLWWASTVYMYSTLTHRMRYGGSLVSSNFFTWDSLYVLYSCSNHLHTKRKINKLDTYMYMYVPCYQIEESSAIKWFLYSPKITKTKHMKSFQHKQ